MKAERRHELKTNTLAHGLEGLPEFGRQYGTKILLAIVAVLAIVVFVRFQARTAREGRALNEEAFAGARAGINNLQGIGFMSDPQAAASQRKTIVEQASAAIQQVLDESKDETLRAEALVARGDLNWHLATGAEIRGADTQPSLKLQEKDEDLLDRAKAAYEAAAQAGGATPLTVATARLSLAAIAEQRSQWDEARKQYEQVIADPRTPEAFKNEARVRVDDLKNLAKPLLIGKPATAPSRQPEAAAGTGPTTAPATTPSTAPAAASEERPEPEKPEEPATPSEPVEAEPQPDAEKPAASPDAPASPQPEAPAEATPDAPPAQSDPSPAPPEG